MKTMTLGEMAAVAAAIAEEEDNQVFLLAAADELASEKGAETLRLSASRTQGLRPFNNWGVTGGIFWGWLDMDSRRGIHFDHREYDAACLPARLCSLLKGGTFGGICSYNFVTRAHAWLALLEALDGLE